MPHDDGTPTGAEHVRAARQHLDQAEDPNNTSAVASQADALIGIGHALLALHYLFANGEVRR